MDLYTHTMEEKIAAVRTVGEVAELAMEAARSCDRLSQRAVKWERRHRERYDEVQAEAHRAQTAEDERDVLRKKLKKALIDLGFSELKIKVLTS